MTSDQLKDGKPPQLAASFPRYRAAHAGRMHRLPSLFGSREPASPTKCGKNILTRWANDRKRREVMKTPATIFATELGRTSRYRTIFSASMVGAFTNKIRLFAIIWSVVIPAKTNYKTGALPLS